MFYYFLQNAIVGGMKAGATQLLESEGAKKIMEEAVGNDYQKADSLDKEISVQVTAFA